MFLSEIFSFFCEFPNSFLVVFVFDSFEKGSCPYLAFLRNDFMHKVNTCTHNVASHRNISRNAD